MKTIDEKQTCNKFFGAAANWFVLFVQTYEEQRVADRLQEKFGGDDLAAFVPTKDYAHKNKKISTAERKLWLRGYVFVATMLSAKECVAKIMPFLMGDSNIYKFLSNDGSRDSIEMTAQDKALMTALLDTDYNISAIECELGADGTINFSDAEVASRVSKVDKHKRTAVLKLCILDREIDVEVMLKIRVAKPAKTGGSKMAYDTGVPRSELLREKKFSVSVTVKYLADRSHFNSASEEIRRQLHKKNPSLPNDKAAEFEYFKTLVTQAGVASRGFAEENEIFFNEKRPVRKQPIKLCFALELDTKVAQDFLWKACNLDGFCFRRVEDVVYCYCLVQNQKNADDVDYKKLTFNDAEAIIKKYKKNFDGKKPDISIGSHGTTDELLKIFANGELENMSLEDLKGKLDKGYDDFISYSKTASREMKLIYQAVIKELKKQAEPSLSAHINDELLFLKDGEPKYTYSGVCEILSSIEDGFETRPTSSSNTRIHEMVSFLFTQDAEGKPEVDKFKGIVTKDKKATNKEFGAARRVYVFLYFAEYVMGLERQWSNKLLADGTPLENLDRFTRFYDRLNDKLEDCGYAYLYYGDLFDWLILKCVYSFCEIVTTLEDSAGIMPLFNETLGLLSAYAQSEEGGDDNE